MRKLLIVDDNADLLFAIQRLLSFYDFTVRTVTDSKACMQEFKSFMPEIVIIDVLLSGEDGRQLCKALRENPYNKEVTLILFSASPKCLENFHECNADGVIEKPFGIKDLLEKIEAAVQCRKKSLAGRSSI
ncbi:MAG: response regulator transcription factor [Chitinophagaceae bacterium]|nr:response regulator transcription factor [Chitinophagaceae bacterium]